jgi:hypothetical protein
VKTPSPGSSTGSASMPLPHAALRVSTCLLLIGKAYNAWQQKWEVLGSVSVPPSKRYVRVVRRTGRCTSSHENAISAVA